MLPTLWSYYGDRRGNIYESVLQTQETLQKVNIFLWHPISQIKPSFLKFKELNLFYIDLISQDNMIIPLVSIMARNICSWDKVIPTTLYFYINCF